MLGLLTAITLAAQPLPDQLDILRGTDSIPQIQLVLDTSGSMAWDPAASVCDFYPTQQNNLLGSYETGGTWYLSRTDQLKAALTGCRSATDGILDQWSSLAMFSVREFGANRTSLLADFDVDLGNRNELEDAVLNLQANGGTPLAQAYQESALHFHNFFNNNNSETCRQNYIVLMTDGVGNTGGDVPFDFVADQPSLEVRNAGSCFGNVTSGCPQPPYPDEAARYLLEDTLGNEVDVLPDLDGVQPIRTYAIGFQAPTAADALLRAMAAQGDGRAFSATSYEQLSAAFSEILNSIVIRSRVAFSVGAISGDGLFSGNYIYVSPFRPLSAGVWVGNTRKYCVIPESSGDDCIFIEGSQPGELLVNPEPREQWTGVEDPRADAGGSGQQTLTQVFGVTSQFSLPPQGSLLKRRIRTWTPGKFGYREVLPSSMSQTEAWTSNTCTHYALFNGIHGFGQTVQDCEGADYDPSYFAAWPQGDTVNAGTLLLQYTPECESSTSQCVVVTATNGGLVHFFDAKNGVELGAIIPGELWAPNGVAHHHLSQRADQPASDTFRRYFIDGKLRLFHEDSDGDLLIDSNERAQLIVGLGRGGRGYYLIDVANFQGFLRDDFNPPRPLLPDTKSLKHLQDTWAAPATTVLPDGTAEGFPVAIFPSGHIAKVDEPSHPLGGPIRIEAVLSPDRLDAPYSALCVDIGLPDDLCQTVDFSDLCDDIGENCAPGTPCSACNDVDPSNCKAAGLEPPFCYDWPGWALLFPEAGVWADHPTDITVGPLSFDDGTISRGEAYRINFSRFDLQPGDYVAFLGEDDNELARIEGAGSATTISSPWLLTPSFSMRLVTDGVNARAADGYAIGSVDVIRDVVPPDSNEVHHPSIYVTDLRRWNQASVQAPPFDATDVGVFGISPSSGSPMSDGLVLRFTDSCLDVAPGVNEVCIDQFTSTLTRQLRWMVCPISAEPSILNEGGVLTAIYFGDECGQVWRIRREVSEQWSAARLLRLNNDETDGFTIIDGPSNDYRKIFTKVDIVNSTCPGQRAVGVYFGTGNVQLAAATDTMDLPSITRPNNAVRATERDVVGVVWDTLGLPFNADLSDLANVTDIRQTTDLASSASVNGWYIELDDNERMLRDPIVFDGLAYFDVYLARGVAAEECVSSLGRNRTLVLDNCTALGYGDVPVNPLLPPTPNEERTRGLRENTTPSSGLAFIAPKTGPAFISVGLGGANTVVSPDRMGRPSARIVRFWRLDK